jgi:hypothetical protein
MKFCLRPITLAIAAAVATFPSILLWQTSAHAQMTVPQSFISQAKQNVEVGFPEAFAFVQEGMQHIGSGDMESAVIAFNESLTISRDIGDRHLESIALIARGKALLEMGNDDSARTSVEQGLAIAQELDDAELEALAQSVIAELE